MLTNDRVLRRHYNNYFEMCKAFNKIYHTKAVQQDEQQWRRVFPLNPCGFVI